MTNGKTSKTTTEKIAFAAVLIISLVAAQSVINLRSLVHLSAPIELNKSGLSIAMPALILAGCMPTAATNSRKGK